MPVALVLDAYSFARPPASSPLSGMDPLEATSITVSLFSAGRRGGFNYNYTPAHNSTSAHTTYDYEFQQLPMETLSSHHLIRIAYIIFKIISKIEMWMQ